MGRRRTRASTPTSTFLLVAVGIVVAVALLRGCATATRTPPRAPSRAALPSSPHLLLGAPIDADSTDDLILDQRDFVVSWSTKRLDPNWVAWQLDARYLGHVPRRNDYRPDDGLPFGVHRVTTHDYSHSGYDRGHLCPSADRDATEEMNSLTFLMTNMVPQLHELNAGPWEKLEKHERSLAEKPDAELYIVAGPVFDENPKTIGNGVAVPRATYKIICALSAGQSAAEATESTDVTAVIIPNEPGVGGRPWADFRTSVDEVERQTGYDFLRALPDGVEAAVEARTAPGG